MPLPRKFLLSLSLLSLACAAHPEDDAAAPMGGASGASTQAGVPPSAAGAQSGGAGGTLGVGGVAGAAGSVASAGAAAGGASGGSAGLGGWGGSAGGNAASGAGAGAALATCPGGPTPPPTWQEHWFEHNQNVKLIDFDECAAIYFDADVPVAQAEWIFPFVSKVWRYSLATYGVMGPERVYAIFHQDKYSGGHPSYHYDASHDNRNVSDAGGGDWSDGNWDLTSHELGHIVESTASHTKYGSPAFGLWQDSKWMEFYQYDVYVGLGMTEHAQVVFDRFTNQSDDFPRAGTRWFRDWFYPLWRDHGHAQVMVRFFSLLEQHFPAQNERMGAMNWGEYVHFTSGAAKTDVKSLATLAFGWPAEWETQLQQAKQKFPQITY
jgi:hypothetical protein